MVGTVFPRIKLKDLMEIEILIVPEKVRNLNEKRKPIDSLMLFRFIIIGILFL